MCGGDEGRQYGDGCEFDPLIYRRASDWLIQPPSTAYVRPLEGVAVLAANRSWWSRSHAFWRNAPASLGESGHDRTIAEI